MSGNDSQANLILKLDHAVHEAKLKLFKIPQKIVHYKVCIADEFYSAPYGNRVPISLWSDRINISINEDEVPVFAVNSVNKKWLAALVNQNKDCDYLLISDVFMDRGYKVGDKILYSFYSRIGSFKR